MGSVLGVLAAGFGTGLSLIVAIGAQNAFVLRQGILRRHVAAVITICVASDLALITLGVQGLGAVVAARPAATTLLRWAGGTVLLGYALLAARRAARPGRLIAGGEPARSAPAAMLTCLLVTWLNPHVYLDTVLLLGGIAAGYGRMRWVFGAGAAAASAAWFAALGLAARALHGVLAHPRAWRTVDSCVALTMAAVGLSLLLGV